MTQFVVRYKIIIYSHTAGMLRVQTFDYVKGLNVERKNCIRTLSVLYPIILRSSDAKKDLARRKYSCSLPRQDQDS